MLLDKFAEDLIQKAYNMDPVIGRDEEIRRVLQILSRRTKNNPILKIVLLCFIFFLLILYNILIIL